MLDATGFTYGASLERIGVVAASDRDTASATQGTASRRSYLPARKFLLKVRSHDVDAPDVGRLHGCQFTARRRPALGRF